MRTGACQSFSDTFAALKSFLAGEQAWDGQMCGGVSATDNNEIFNAFRMAYGSGLTVGSCDDYNLFVKNICMDLQFRNTGSTLIIFDFHSLMCRKVLNTADRIDAQFSASLAETNTQAGFSRSATNPGYSIFQNPLFLQYWKVLRKWQVQLGPGEVTTLQVRINPNRMIRGKTIETHLQSIPKLTRAIFWSTKGAPADIAGVANTSAGSYAWSSQITVVYQLPPSSTRVSVATEP